MAENEQMGENSVNEQVGQSATTSENEALNDIQSDNPTTAVDDGENVSGGNNNTNGDNASSSDTESVGSLREKIGEKNALILEAYKDTPEKLQELLKTDKSLRKTAEKKGITIDSLLEKQDEANSGNNSKNEESDNTSGTDTENQQQQENTDVKISEDSILQNISNTKLSATDLVKVQQQAQKLVEAGIGSDLAIATAEKSLGFSVSDQETKPVGALPVSGGGSGSEEVSKNVNKTDWITKSFEEQEEYRSKFGEPKF